MTLVSTAARVTCWLMTKIEVFTQPWCPYCSRVVSLLTKQGVAFHEIDAPHGSAERRDAMTRSGRNTMPQVFVNGRNLGGCDDVLALDRSGKLDPILAG